MEKVRRSPAGQAMAAEPVKMGAEAFKNHNNTEITWLTNASILINSHGTDVMIDPLMMGFDMPILVESPLSPEDVPHLDAVLITHYDNDHYSRPTLAALKEKTAAFHAPAFVAGTMPEECGLSGTGHEIGDKFAVNDLQIELTPARHNWQNGSSKYGYRCWEEKDYCGFWIDTPDGSIWIPGDSKLMDEHLHMPTPDAIIMDFADNIWHITFDGAVKLAAAYPDTDLILIHWGCVDAPDQPPFAGDPERFKAAAVNPERVHILAPGEPFVLKKRGAE